MKQLSLQIECQPGTYFVQVEMADHFGFFIGFNSIGYRLYFSITRLIAPPALCFGGSIDLH
ncbi:MAG: hypothetical protein GQ574_15435 [Crocinitomix sp.]|nr:hypothetical protein [Crocinitomix sp.]